MEDLEVKKNKIEFLKAWLKVQSQLQPAKKESNNPHFRSKFADLSSCYEACKQTLSEHGFVILQEPVLNAETLDQLLRTKLTHVSGYGIEGEIYVCGRETTPQAKFAAFTYLRRLALVTMVGIATENDDGNSATQAHPAPKTPLPKPMSKMEAYKMAGEFIIEFGADKGKHIKDLDRSQVEKMLVWCKEKDKFKEFQYAALSYLETPGET